MGGHYDKSIFISDNETVPNDWEIVANAANQEDRFNSRRPMTKKLPKSPLVTYNEGTANNFITVLKTLNTLGEVKEKLKVPRY